MSDVVFFEQMFSPGQTIFHVNGNNLFGHYRGNWYINGNGHDVIPFVCSLKYPILYPLKE
jgi:hypothetical protein